MLTGRILPGAYRSDMKLENLLDREQVDSLSDYLKKMAASLMANTFDTAPEPSWTLTIVTQERGTKREVFNSLHYSGRESAVAVAAAIDGEIGRGPGHVIVVESPDGARLSFMAGDFRRTKLDRFDA